MPKSVRHPVSVTFVGVLGIMICLFSLAGSRPANGNDQIPYRLGIFPLLPPVQLENAYGPVAVALGDAVERDVVFRTKSTFKAYRDALRTQTYDIALVQPFDYVETARDNGYEPVAKRGEPLTAILVTNARRGMTSVADLADGRLGWPPETAAVSFLMRRHFRSLKFDASEIEDQYFRNHVACLHALIIDQVAGCVSAPTPLAMFEQHNDVQLQVIAESPEIPHVLFVVHERVPESDRALIAQTILSWQESRDGRNVLETMGAHRGFVTARDAHYDAVRRLNR